MRCPYSKSYAISAGLDVVSATSEGLDAGGTTNLRHLKFRRGVDTVVRVRRRARPQGSLSSLFLTEHELKSQQVPTDKRINVKQ